MRLKFAILLCIVLSPLFTYAQGCITVFSEDGDKFYLVLNGVKQNPTPQTNVRVDGLPNEYYSAKIIFEDQSKSEIAKSIPVKDAGTGQFAEMTYKIKRSKDGELKLRYFSATPVPVNYNPPADMYSTHYGQPMPGNTITQTTVTQTQYNNPNNGGASITINPGGGEPNNGSVTQTTTTTTTSMDMQQQPANGCLYPMPWRDYKGAKAAVVQAGFEDTKLSTAKAILTTNCLSTDEVMDICRAFGFEASKLEFAKFAYPRTTDPANYFKVNTVFDFDASKTDLNNYISSHAR